jgi:hypothetical protein
MSNDYEWGDADGALYELHTRARALEELLPDDEDQITKPFVLGLWNENGDGLALQGTRRELVNYLTLALDNVKRETDPRLELDQALKRLHALRAERDTITETQGDTGYGLAEMRRLDEEEVGLLIDLAETAEAVNDELYPF